MHHLSDASDPAVDAVDAAHRQVSAAQRVLLESIARLEPDRDWQQFGARDAAHWLAMRFDISEWKARRWIATAQALDHLPRLASSLEHGELGLDKVVELARFATERTEVLLIAWAQLRSCAAVRRRADLEVRPSPVEVAEVQAARSLDWWSFDEGRQLALSAQLPAAEGAVVVRAISRFVRQVPTMPGEEPELSRDRRRADALVALCSTSIAVDPDPARATVVVHATFEDLRAGGNGETEQGDVVIPGPSLRRLLCTARIQTVVESGPGTAVGVGRATRLAPPWLVRQVRHRDRECRFPGCGARAFTEAHHIDWWRDGGRTDLDNLVLICSFHHRLVHEHGWSLEMATDGSVTWFDPRQLALGGRSSAPPGTPPPMASIRAVEHPGRSPGHVPAA